jgi:hypothetical protein
MTFINIMRRRAGGVRESRVQRVHWSVIAKRRGKTRPPYNPRNLSEDIPAEKIAEMTDDERDLLHGEE